VRAAAFVVLTAGWCPHAASAQDAGAASSPPIAARFQVDWLAAVRASAATDSPLNPGNARLRLPQLIALTELRGDLRLELGPRVQFVVRPRARGQVTTAWVDGQRRVRDDDLEGDWTEAYVALRPSDAVSITYGLQNFQWGPTELVAPNNRIFHETGFFRDPLYYVRGRHLLRVNVSAGKQWSFVALGELGDNGDVAFRAGEQFARQALAKLEFTSADGASYVGATAGATDGTPPWLGAYGVLGITEGLSFYADTSHTRGSQAWYPVRVAGASVPGATLGTGTTVTAPTFARPFTNVPSWRSLAVVGARYTFARGDDVRVEWLGQDAGWHEADLRVGFDAARLATSPEAFAPYLAPGLEFLGRQLVLVSVRTPELPPRDRVEVQTRYLHSFTDGSRVIFVTGRWEAGDALVVFASATATGGAPFGEFSRLVGASLVVGTQWTW
jgi:hypothetical protein